MLRSLTLILGFTTTLTAAPPDPVRYLPAETGVYVRIESIRKVVDAVVKHPLSQPIQDLEPVREALDSAQARQFFKLVKYYETDLGKPWPELLDNLAGSGTAVGIVPGYPKDKEPAPKTLTLAAFQGTDAKLTTGFLEKALAFARAEAEKDDKADRVIVTKFLGREIIELKSADSTFLCRDEAAILVSNDSKMLGEALARADAKTSKSLAGNPGPAAAKKLLGGSPTVWAWIDLEPIKALPETKEVLKQPRNDLIQTLLFCAELDVIRRSAFSAIGLYFEGNDYRLRIAMPAGREGLGQDSALHLPRDVKKPAAYPLLTPNETLFSHSFYWDLATLWNERETLLTAGNAKALTDGDKQVSKILPNTTVGELLQRVGPYHRLVAVNQPKNLYSVEPRVKLPAFAFVTQMSDPAQARSYEMLIRAGMLALSTQYGASLNEPMIGEKKALSYRFNVKKDSPDDPQKIRFNFEPTFVVVKDQYIAASTKALAEELAGIIAKETPPTSETANMRMRFDSAGAQGYLKVVAEQVLIQAILDRGYTEAQAKLQSDLITKLVGRVGRFDIVTTYEPKTFSFDISWKWK